MQMFLELAQLGIGRIWLDDVAEAELPVDRRVQIEVDPPERGWFLLDEVAIEVALTADAIQGYGLLGCAFERANTGGTTLVAHVGESSDAPHLADALQGSVTDQRCRLDEEQAHAVLEGARDELVRRGSSPAGTLAFHVALTSASATDPALLARLGALCVRLMDVSIEADEETCASLVAAALAPRHA